MNVGKAEFPVLFGLIDARLKSLSLLILGQMEKYFDDPGAVAVEMFLEVDDGGNTRLNS